MKWQTILMGLLLSLTTVLAFTGSGSGTQADPYLITNWSQLAEINNDYNAFYALANDVDMAGSPYQNGTGWQPIDWTFDNSPDNLTNAGFDGQGYTIRNLFINDTVAGYACFIETIDWDNAGENFTFINTVFENVTVNENGGTVFAGVVMCYHTETSELGKTELVFENVQVYNGTINVTATGGGSMGGLFSDYYSTTNDADQRFAIRNLSFEGNIYNQGHMQVGGLFGYLEGTNLENSYFKGNITQVDASYNCSSASSQAAGVGGLTGWGQYNIFNNTYVLGSITGACKVSGIGREIFTNTSSAGFVSGVYDSYVSATLTSGDNWVEPLISYDDTVATNEPVDCDNSYWEYAKTSNLTSSCEGDSFPTTKYELKDGVLFQNWDTDIWEEEVGIYPYLLWQIPPTSTPSVRDVFIASISGGLNCTYTFQDADNDAEANSTFKWFLNGTSLGITDQNYTVSVSATDRYICEVTPQDEYATLGEPVNSSEYYVGDVTPPSISAWTIPESTTIITRVYVNVTCSDANGLATDYPRYSYQDPNGDRSINVTMISGGGNNYYNTRIFPITGDYVNFTFHCKDGTGNEVTNVSSSVMYVSPQFSGIAEGGGGVSEPKIVFVEPQEGQSSCGIDADGDSDRCDLNEDWISCPQDCETPTLDQLFCTTGSDCLWGQAWFLKLLFAVLLVISIYLVVKEGGANKRRRVR